MTTDNFTEAARAEAKRYWLEGPDAPSPETLGEHMAEWARAHLAAQEPTDAEVRTSKAEAWDEAYRLGVEDARLADDLRVGVGLGPDLYAQPARQNPYREEPTR